MFGWLGTHASPQGKKVPADHETQPDHGYPSWITLAGAYRSSER